APFKAKFDDAICQAQKSTVETTKSQSAFSVADELKKFKELLDMDIITQEEFDAKKKQLLGL
ncbi:MAG: SHOCT domain-containing protein, partial [Clostridia bacterium]|nr:SHOCT domain-containing protein [Clostridia bacterium]